MPRKIALVSIAVCAALALFALSFAQDVVPPKGRQYTPPNYVFSPEFRKTWSLMTWRQGFNRRRHPGVGHFIALNWPVPIQSWSAAFPTRRILPAALSLAGAKAASGISPADDGVGNLQDTNDIYLKSGRNQLR